MRAAGSGIENNFLLISQSFIQISLSSFHVITLPLNNIANFIT